MARKKSPKKDYVDISFQKLAESVNRSIIAHKGIGGDQKQQVESLIKAEEAFREFLSKSDYCNEVYKRFVRLIVDENENVLMAQPYFRESKSNFFKNISKKIKNKEFEKLNEYAINYRFAKFAVENWPHKGHIPSELNTLFEEINRARNLLITNNMPLAINKAKTFYNSTPKAHLTLIDFINICSDGLTAGIDKFTGTYSKVFLSVCIGRMVGFMIKEYSKTFVVLGSEEKQILYRANSVRFQYRIDNISQITKIVNSSFKEDKAKGVKVPKLPIAEMVIEELLNCSGYSQSEMENDEGGYFDLISIENKASTESIEDGYARREDVRNLILSSKDLPLIEQKVLKMRGIGV